MSKIKKRWWPILSIFLMVLSSFPIQTIAENLQTVETSRVTNLQLTDSQGNILSKEIKPDALIISKFDLSVGEKEKSTWLLPAEVTTKDKEIYHEEDVTLTIENNQLTVVNDNDQPASIEGVKFEFQLSDQVRSLSQVTLNFFNTHEFQLDLKQEIATKETTSEKSAVKKKTADSSQKLTPFGGGITPFAATDKTSEINDMKLNNIYIKNGSNPPIYIVKEGVKQDPQPTIKVGDGVYFDYTFTVPSSANLKDGDFIYIALPEEYFNFSSVSNSVPFYESSGDKIGDMTLETISGKKFLKITFNDAVETNWNGLQDCYATAYGTASQESSGGSTGNTETGSYPIEIDPKPAESYPGKPIGDQKPITKNGGATNNSNRVYWNIPIMMDNYKKAFEDDGPSLYKKVVLKDQLDPSLTLIEYSAYMNIYAADEDGNMTSDNLGSFQMLSTTNTNTSLPLESLTQNISESDADFETRIESHNYPCYGVTSDNKLVMNFKDLPNLTNDKSNGLLLFGNAARSTKERIWDLIDTAVNDGKMTALRGDKTKEAYENYFSVDSGQTYDNYPFGLVVRITCSTTLGEGSIIENKAMVYWETNTSGEESDVSKVTVSNWGGGATRVPPTTFRLKKMDKDTQVILKDVEFELKKETPAGSNTYVTISGGKKKTDSNGVLLYENLTDGNYCLVEVSNPDPRYTDKLEIIPPDGKNESGKYYFTIDKNAAEGVAVSAYNELAKGKITLVKKDADTDEKLNGAKFTLRKKNGDELVTPQVLLESGKNYLYQYNDTGKKYELVEDIGSTAKNGEITVSGLPIDEYYFQEEAAPDGYTYDDDGKSNAAKITTDGETVSVTRENRKKVGKLKLTKKNSDNEKLNGAEFELYLVNPDNSEIKMGTKFVTGKEYEYTYNTTSDTYEFIEGAGTKGEITITGLPLGKYYLLETKAPDGHKIVGDGKTAINEITEEGVTITFEVTNERAEGGVTLEKKDATNDKNLKGAKFKVATNSAGTTWFASEELEVGDGTAVKGTYKAVKTGATWNFQPENVVTPTGQLVITGLPEETYYFVETQAPTGYVQLSSPVQFTIIGGQLATANIVTVENHPKGTLPETGGNGYTWFTRLAPIALLIVSGYFANQQFKRKKAGVGR
ncbi:MSCRAMM family protein [Enterococcus raffinosus]|uniref:SpaA isopeptide-forming pilin-related protein n=1 Tax=Enterococcus raffinosus TaxID=71452 RepID=A0AAW8TC28_9ENTE|nr:SpaA isopeptide-forming pilin-related protein [Enterococcus raffinosus]MDT2524808.1 SpaA isopeptide-forming pilin-related protein [Enterococcus raffinosus]MDT2530818.1 SpaA isopeptide-forming pilin-related protein [Enterococcus raffinosus]MDT2535525.1 SpaA isopeptide-forming pilin-related protein [Enterococcus raffinosus]MDT2545847.1 SpaA isopeptide-forming pilin-related protein [Enterococcus raffinosus]MDT2556454.1 SpaA isopeptide-forming pilin-related protein [Enterococcus raffinosus]